jgi:hypothetical protein
MHAGWFGDDLYLCSPAHVVERLWQWDESRPGLVDVSPKLAELRRLRCSTLHPEVPLSGDFVWQGGTLGWRLGPQTEGRWWFVFEEGHEAHEVPAHGGFQLGDVGELTFRLRYDAPAGWSTYSPPLHLDSRRQKRYVWRRPAASVPTTPPRGSS